MQTPSVQAPVNTNARKVVTLEQFIIEGEKNAPHASGEFSQLLRDILLGARLVNREVNRAGLVDILGAMGGENVQGEAQQKLDVFANDQFIHALRLGGQCCAIASEEDDEMIMLNPHGEYVVLIDPLDGSSNIDVNVSIGTVFSIYRRVSQKGMPATEADCLQPGRNQLAAGYVLYGSSTLLVLTVGQGVHGFTLDPSLGEFFLSHPNIRQPEEAYYYSINEGRSDQFTAELQNYLKDIKVRNAASDEKALVPRYIGSMVADFHRNLLKGGIFMYPGSISKPQGKLRLLYEANPIAFLTEQSGGIAIDGKNRILDIQPTKLHQRTPLFTGSAQEVKHLHSFLAPNN